MISAIILAKNEEKNIIDCLQGLKWVSEIIVIDDNSTDKTAEIAKNMGVRVINHSLSGDWATQRNIALTEAQHEYVLFVDADERVSPELAKEINEEVKSNQKIDGYFVKREDYFLKKWLKYGETANVRLLRLGRKEAGLWENKVHEVWRIKGKTKTLVNPLKHLPHPTVHEFLEDINVYSSIRAKELFDNKVKIHVWQTVGYPIAKFAQNYFFRKGFLDGKQGFIVAMMMSIHSFLVRVKLYYLYKGVGDEITRK